jgi:hypothetical protein
VNKASPQKRKILPRKRKRGQASFLDRGRPRGKSLRDHTAMQVLFLAWYNFARKHETLKGATPAMASRLTDHVWTIKELIEKAAGE